MKLTHLTKHLTTAAVVLPVLFASCGEKTLPSASEPLVLLAQVQSTNTEQHSSYPGRTEASQTSSVAYRVSGTIDRVCVKEGDHVRQGQLIAQMDDRDYKVQLQATEAEYYQIKAECERVIGLYQDGSTSENNYDKARYGLEQITAKYQHAKDQLADCQLKAPFNGYVQKVLFDAHETVAAGMPVATLFCSDGLEILINIPASEYLKKDLFDSFSASFDILPGVSFPLQLINISHKANANQLYEVRLLLLADGNEQSVHITPGMNAMVDIKYASEESSLSVVPTTAVFEKEGGSYVYVFDALTNTVHATEVKVASLCSDGNSVIMADIKSGEKVVRTGVRNLVDGQKVIPQPEVSASNAGGIL